MIKKIAQTIWDFLVALGEAKQARMKQQNYKMWY
jgi:hypothetical protein